MPLSKAAQARIAEKARGFLGKVKVAVSAAKKEDILNVATAASYDSAEYITSLVAAEKAQRILNRVRAAVAAGQMDANALDVQKLRDIAGEALSTPAAGQVMQTLLRSAYNAGRYEYQLTDDTRPYLLYRTMRDSRVRLEHSQLEGLMLPASDPIWKVIYPPNGHGCRCRVDSLTIKQATYLQGASKRIKLVAPGNVEVLVTPGFNAPPSARARDLQQFLDKRMRELSA
ncbi:hypothetical protein DZC30_02445 [Comamonas testosteroni]|uniref:Phage head morphogenesis domain-containing protein n=1 Tax=Comamonas testosteroni TaxID=285 RepID=A0A373FT62_COMTE|nr:phage minor head protein [Comamonas testosteroni]RGE46655.1 hypothetical protein DZC30_02445 [Comamonas testosteroni]